MAIQYTRTFTFEDSEAENIRRGVAFIHGMANKLSMTDLRGVISKHTEGSYAKFTELFALGNAQISLTEEAAGTLIAVANDVCAKANEKDIRKLRTWLSALLADIKTAEQESNEERICEQPQPMANAS